MRVASGCTWFEVCIWPSRGQEYYHYQRAHKIVKFSVLNHRPPLGSIECHTLIYDVLKPTLRFLEYCAWVSERAHEFVDWKAVLDVLGRPWKLSSECISMCLRALSRVGEKVARPAALVLFLVPLGSVNNTNTSGSAFFGLSKKEIETLKLNWLPRNPNSDDHSG